MPDRVCFTPSGVAVAAALLVVSCATSAWSQPAARSGSESSALSSLPDLAPPSKTRGLLVPVQAGSPVQPADPAPSSPGTALPPSSDQAPGPDGDQTSRRASAAEITDRLATALRQATDSASASVIEAHLRAFLMRPATPAVRLLLSRAGRELEAGETGDAMADFDAAIELQPGLGALYRLRAQARFRAGDYPGAVRDEEAAISREPRDFQAFQDLSSMAGQHGDSRGALRAWEKLLELDPRTPDGQDHLQELRRRAYGSPA